MGCRVQGCRERLRVEGSRHGACRVQGLGLGSRVMPKGHAV